MIEFELVVPAYNEGATIERLVRRTRDAAVVAGLDGARFQLVVVDNGSTDGTRATLGALKSTELGDCFRVVTIEVNRGYGAGVISGLRNTSARFVGFSHADLQCDPADAFRALAILRQEPRSVVKGRRIGRGTWARVFSGCFALLARAVLGLPVGEVNAQPKVFARELLEELPFPPDGIEFDLYVLYRAVKAGYPCREIEVGLPPRASGASHWAATSKGRCRAIGRAVRHVLCLRIREGRIS